MRTVVSHCPIEEVMRVLSGRWPTLLIYYLVDGPKRFSELRRDNPTISHRILTLELRKLEAAGIVARRERTGFPRHVEYALSEAGRRLLPSLSALGAWWKAERMASGGRVIAS